MARARARMRKSRAPEGWVYIHRVVWGAECPNVSPNVRTSQRSLVSCVPNAALRASSDDDDDDDDDDGGEGVRVTTVRRVARRDGARDGDRVRHRGRALRVRGLVSQERAVRRDPGLDFPARWVHVCDDVRGDEFDVDVDVV